MRKRNNWKKLVYDPETQRPFHGGECWMVGSGVLAILDAGNGVFSGHLIELSRDQALRLFERGRLEQMAHLDLAAFYKGEMRLTTIVSSGQ